MTTTMRIPYIAVDKYVATPYNPGEKNGFPTSATEYYQLGIQVVNDDGTLPNKPVPVYLGDDQDNPRIQYWKADQSTNITDDVDNNLSVDTDVHGFLTVYIAVSNYQTAQYPGCIFEVYASVTPNYLTDGVNQTLTCCYYTYEDAQKVQDMSLDPLVLSNDEDGLVTIPAWNEHIYSLPILLTSQSQNVNPNAKLSIVVNGKRVDNSSYTYQSLALGVEIPYALMVEATDDQANNCIVYMTDDGTPRSSVPWQFPISGVPLLMPDPKRTGRYHAPWWTGAAPGQPPKSEPLTINDLMGGKNGNGFEVGFYLDDKVKQGDIYRVYIYLNGYTEDGTPHTRLLGDGSKIPGTHWGNILEFMVPKGAQAKDIETVLAPIFPCEGFLELDAVDFGYCWVNFQVNGRDWSHPYVAANRPIKINFGTLDTDTEEPEED